MSLSKKLIDAVESGNIDDIRDCLIVTLLDSSGKSYEESISYCKCNGIANIFEKHDGEKDIFLAPSKENSAELLGQLRINFSEERVNARLKMGKMLNKKDNDIPTQKKAEPVFNDSKVVLSSSKVKPEEEIITKKVIPVIEKEPQITHEERIISERVTPEGEGKKNNDNFGKYIIAGGIAIILIAAIATCSGGTSKKQHRDNKQGSYSTRNK